MPLKKPLSKFLILAIPFSIASCSYISPQIEAVHEAHIGRFIEIFIIDVGQGQSTLIKTSYGKSVLIDGGDTGKGIANVLPIMATEKLRKLDYIIATHYHSDHIGGLDEVIRGIGGNESISKNAYDRGGYFKSSAFEEYSKEVGSKRRTLKVGQSIKLDDGLEIACVSADGRTKAGLIYSGNDENALSIGMLLSYHDFQLFVGGDIDSQIEGYVGPFVGDVDVYVVDHHGSDTSSGLNFLSEIRPEVSVISVGNGNRYNHPSASTISRLVDAGSYIYQTEAGVSSPPDGFGEIVNGNVQIISDGEIYTIYGANKLHKTRDVDEITGLRKKAQQIEKRLN